MHPTAGLRGMGPRPPTEHYRKIIAALFSATLMMIIAGIEDSA